MPESYEKDGIIYFKEPYRIDYFDWAFSHKYCDWLALERVEYNENVGCGETIYVVCYAPKPELNERIETLLDTMEYPEPLILCRGYVPPGSFFFPTYRVEEKKLKACYKEGLYYVHICFNTLNKFEFERSVDFIFDTASLYTVISPDVLFTPVMRQIISDLGWMYLELEPVFLKTPSDTSGYAYKMCFRDVRVGTILFEKFYFYILPHAEHKLAVLGTDFINYCSSISFDRRDIVFDVNFKEYYDSGDPVALRVTDSFLKKFALNVTDIDESDLKSVILSCYNRQGGYTVPDSYEKDGIVYYEKPYRVDSMKWYFDHRFCNSLILDKHDYIEGGAIEMDYVCCYASAPEYNDALKEVQKSGMYGDNTEIVEGCMEDPNVYYI